MAGFGPGEDGFEDLLRSVATEFGRYLERSLEQLDLDQVVEQFGVDPVTLRGWVETTGGWLRAQAEGLAEEFGGRMRQQRAAACAEVLDKAAPHPLDPPSEEQGLALAALDSGRWCVEPGTDTLMARAGGPPPADALGVVRELRTRDWIDREGELTLAGRHALGRWLKRAQGD